MTAASPGIIATAMGNAYYDSHERYVFAVAKQMQKEYELIHAKGFILATRLSGPGDGACHALPGRPVAALPGGGGDSHCRAECGHCQYPC